MQPPMIGSWIVEVMAVRPFMIHGDLYYELQIVRMDEPGGNAFILRVPQHATAAEPAAGETLTISFLMGQVTSAKPAG